MINRKKLLDWVRSHVRGPVDPERDRRIPFAVHQDLVVQIREHFGVSYLRAQLLAEDFVESHPGVDLPTALYFNQIILVEQATRVIDRFGEWHEGLPFMRLEYLVGLNSHTAPAVCRNCASFSGHMLGGNYFHCAVHPFGTPEGECKDKTL